MKRQKVTRLSKTTEVNRSRPSVDGHDDDDDGTAADHHLQVHTGGAGNDDAVAGSAPLFQGKSAVSTAHCFFVLLFYHATVIGCTFVMNPPPQVDVSGFHGNPAADADDCGHGRPGTHLVHSDLGLQTTCKESWLELTDISADFDFKT